MEPKIESLVKALTASLPTFTASEEARFMALGEVRQATAMVHKAASDKQRAMLVRKTHSRNPEKAVERAIKLLNDNGYTIVKK